MASYSTNEFRGGLKIMLDGDPYNIVENEFVKPGKGQAFNRVRVRNLKTGRVVEKTFKSGESVEAADIFVFYSLLYPGFHSPLSGGHPGATRCEWSSPRVG